MSRKLLPEERVTPEEFKARRNAGYNAWRNSLPATVRPGAPKSRPWQPEQVEKLLASCQVARGRVGEATAATWWPAIVLASLDCPTCVLPELLAVRGEAYQAGTLAVGDYIYELRDQTQQAIHQLLGQLRQGRQAERLFAWHRDPAGEPFHSLRLHFKRILLHAGLPATHRDGFNRLQATAVEWEDAEALPLDWIRIRDLADVLRTKRRPVLNGRGEPCGRPSVKRRRPPLTKDNGIPTPRPKLTPEEKTARSIAGFHRWQQKKAARLPVIIKSESDRRLRVFLDAFYKPRRLDGVAKATTYLAYRGTINNLERYAGCEVTIDQLSDDLLEAYTAARIQAGWSVHTANRDLRHLSTLWSYAYRKKLVNDRPGVEERRVPKRLPMAWSIDELQRILHEAAQEGRGELGGVPVELLLPALILFAYDTGWRIDAALSVRCDQVDFGTGWVVVPAEEQKHKCDEAKRLHPQTLFAIKATYPEQRELLFPVSRKAKGPLYNAYREVLLAAGLPYGPKHLFHKLRKTSGTYVADAAGDDAASRHLGHSSVSITRGNYIDPTKLTRISAVGHLPRPSWSGSDAASIELRRVELLRQIAETRSRLNDLEQQLADLFGKSSPADANATDRVPSLNPPYMVSLCLPSRPNG